MHCPPFPPYPPPALLQPSLPQPFFWIPWYPRFPPRFPLGFSQISPRFLSVSSRFPPRFPPGFPQIFHRFPPGFLRFYPRFSSYLPHLSTIFPPGSWKVPPGFPLETRLNVPMSFTQLLVILKFFAIFFFSDKKYLTLNIIFYYTFLK